MLPDNPRNMWKKFYILVGKVFTLRQVNDIIHRRSTREYIMYKASCMIEAGYVICYSTHHLEFTDKFINEVVNVTQ